MYDLIHLIQRRCLSIVLLFVVNMCVRLYRVKDKILSSDCMDYGIVSSFMNSFTNR